MIFVGPEPVNEQAVDGWLQSLGSTTFGGKGWDISDDKERPEAVKWIIKMIHDIENYRQTEGKES